MPRVIFPDCTPYMAQYFDEAARAIVPELALHVGTPSTAEFVRAAQDAVAVVHFQTRLSEPMLVACPKLKVIVFLGTGVSSWVDLPAAERCGIKVRRVLGYADRTVAEHALALVFACARRIAAMDREIRAGIWRADALFELAGKTLGVIGLGGIGREMARLGVALGMRVIAWNRSSVTEPLPYEPSNIDEIMRRADVVSLHLALNDETRGVIDRRRLALMKPGSVFVNTARGGLVDQAALAELLLTRRIGAAGIDVFAQEPQPASDPLNRLDNVVLTAHSAWMSPEAARRLVRLGVKALADELAKLDGV